MGASIRGLGGEKAHLCKARIQQSLFCRCAGNRLKEYALTRGGLSGCISTGEKSAEAIVPNSNESSKTVEASFRVIGIRWPCLHFIPADKCESLSLSVITGGAGYSIIACAFSFLIISIKSIRFCGKFFLAISQIIS